VVRRSLVGGSFGEVVVDLGRVWKLLAKLAKLWEVGRELADA
jgi:hypothetical protein